MPRKFLQSILNKYNDLFAILITDRDGVIVCKVCTASSPEVSQQSRFISVFTSASKGSKKMGLGENRSIVTFYDTFQVVSIGCGAVALHFIATPEGNTGRCLRLDTELQPIMPTVLAMVQDEYAQQEQAAPALLLEGRG